MLVAGGLLTNMFRGYLTSEQVDKCNMISGTPCMLIYISLNKASNWQIVAHL